MTNTTDPTDLELKLTRISQLKAQLDLVKPIKDELDALKDEVFRDMQATRSKRTEATAGVYAVRVERTTPWVSDPEKLTHWLIQNDYPESDYMKTELNLERVVVIAKDVLDKDGEILPGLESRTTESIQIRSAKA